MTSESASQSRLSLASLWLRKAWSETLPEKEKRWEALTRPVAAAAASAFLVVFGVTQGAWRQQAASGLVAGLGTLVLYLFVTFTRNLLKAPRKIRKAMAHPPGLFGAVAYISARVRDTDVMQREAAGIAAEIREYLERREKPGLVEQPYERQRIEDKIERFGYRARNDQWITRRSQKRSLRLHAEIASSKDLVFISNRCLQFQDQKPSH